MSSLNEKEHLNLSFKEAISLENQRLIRYRLLASNTRDRDLKKMLYDFQFSSRSRITILKREMANLNIL